MEFSPELITEGLYLKLLVKSLLRIKPELITEGLYLKLLLKSLSRIKPELNTAMWTLISCAGVCGVDVLLEVGLLRKPDEEMI